MGVGWVSKRNLMFISDRLSLRIAIFAMCMWWGREFCISIRAFAVSTVPCTVPRASHCRVICHFQESHYKDSLLRKQSPFSHKMSLSDQYPQWLNYGYMAEKKYCSLYRATILCSLNSCLKSQIFYDSDNIQVKYINSSFIFNFLNLYNLIFMTHIPHTFDILCLCVQDRQVGLTEFYRIIWCEWVEYK